MREIDGIEPELDATATLPRPDSPTADRPPFKSITRLRDAANGASLEIGGSSNGAAELSADAVPAIAVPRRVRVPVEHAAGGALKRAFDLAVAAVLLVLTAPLVLAIAVLIKLDSPGPVLYRSRRVGRNRSPFEMFKFRTMVDGADELRDSLRPLNEASHGFFKLSSDPRMTRVGRYLRATCLDELPQLFQVLSGRMSLVGPRPLVIEESEQIPAASARFMARPGITGPWQLAGSWRVPIPEMVEMDCDYIDEWSVWLDLKLLIRTAVYAVRRGGV